MEITIATIATITFSLIGISIYEWNHRRFQRQVFKLANERWTDLDNNRKLYDQKSFDKTLRLFLITLCTYKEYNLLTLWRLRDILKLPLDEIVRLAVEAQEIELY